MKKIITPVGTSLFENYLESRRADTNFKTVYMSFKNNKERADELDKEKNKRKKIEEVFNEEYFKNNINASAEIKSLIKIKEKLKEDELKIYLLYSDTALGRLAAEIIKEFLPLYNEFGKAEIEIKKIENLQIWDKDNFEKGMKSLINEIYEIANNGYYWNNIIINITGGFKATIPYLTILAQINNCPLYYIFENTDSLMEITNIIPIEIKTEIFENYYGIFEKIENESPKINEIDNDFRDKCASFIKRVEIDNNEYVELNLLGQILWKNYKSKFFVFYAPEDIYKEIENQENIKRIIKEKFSIMEMRKNKTEQKNNHFVYDDGNNQYRIFYFENSRKIYIYKTFEDHNEYEKYLRGTPFNENLKNNITNKSKKYKWEVK
jgi:putative CRISPR-associated protein (TIGR02619 family)